MNVEKNNGAALLHLLGRDLQHQPDDNFFYQDVRRLGKGIHQSVRGVM